MFSCCGEAGNRDLAHMRWDTNHMQDERMGGRVYSERILLSNLNRRVSSLGLYTLNPALLISDFMHAYIDYLLRLPLRSSFNKIPRFLYVSSLVYHRHHQTPQTHIHVPPTITTTTTTSSHTPIHKSQFSNPNSHHLSLTSLFLTRQ